MSDNPFINQVPTQEMIDFVTDRINRHIKSVNYFASLIGRHYPDHDLDKFDEPLFSRYVVGYWYLFNNDTSLADNVTPEFREAFIAAKKPHYQTRSHHTDYWGNPHDMPPVALEEMACDMFAMCAEKNMRGLKRAKKFLDYWVEDTPQWFQYSKEQDSIMRDLFAKLEARWNRDDFLKIWE